MRRVRPRRAVRRASAEPGQGGPPRAPAIRLTPCVGLLLLLTAASGAELRAERKTALQQIDPAVRVGARVSVKGQPLEDGTLLAHEIEIKKSDDTDDELEGPLEALDGENRRFVLLGRVVRVRSKTVIRHRQGRPATFEDLRDGLRIKVDGDTDADGLLEADKIRIDREDRAGRVKVEGPIRSLVPHDDGLALAEVAGVRVRLLVTTDLVGSRGGSRPLVRRLGGVADDEDLMFTRDTRLGRHVALAGEVRLRAEALSNLDLDEQTSDRKLVPEVTAQVGFAASLGRAYGYLTFVGAKEFPIGSESSFDSRDGTALVGEAYVQFPLASRVSMAIGRQRFNDEREWYYNSRNLDAVRLFADFYPVSFQASISRTVFNEHRNVRDQELSNLILQGAYRVAKDLELEAFWIDRRDRTELGDSPRTIGLRLLGELGRHVDLWVDVARQTGTVCSKLLANDEGELFDSGRRCNRTEQPGAFNVRDLRAYAYDLGLTYRPRIRLDPAFTVSYAAASGEDDTIRALGAEEAATTTATSFRQSGLHRNRWNHNGVVSFRYYGDVMDPELFNLRILTLGVGLRPTRAASIDVLYHDYRQDRASRSFHEFEIDDTPSGVDPRIGREWNLALGYEPTRRYELRLTGGVFLPGPALDRDARTASVARFQAKFRF